MALYQFSVGKVTIKEGASIVETVLPLRDVDIKYNRTVSKKLDPDGIPTDEFVEEESVDITISYATENGVNLSNLKGKDLDLYFEAGDEGHGVSVTIASCKLSDYSYKQAQSEYTVVTCTFSKASGDIDSSPGATPTRQKVYFGEVGSWVQIGDSAYVNTSFAGNTQSIIIPTALGVLIRSTAALGGGQLSINVNGYISKDTRLELEQYLINLYSSLSTGKKSLKVEYGATSYTIDDVYWVSGSPEASNKKYGDFTLSFMKSAY